MGESSALSRSGHNNRVVVFMMIFPIITVHENGTDCLRAADIFYILSKTQKKTIIKI